MAVGHQQGNPLAAYLAANGIGKQIAGNSPPLIKTLAPVGSQASFKAPPAAPQQPQANVNPGGLTSFYSDPAHSDYLSDPVLLQIQAADQAAQANAESAALKARESLVAQLGSTDLARQILGQDDPTLGAVSADPDKSTSILARLARGYRDTVTNNEDQRNKANLWYSSARAEGLKSDAQDYTTQQADAIANAQAQLDAISSQLASARGTATEHDQQALEDAYQRYLTAVQANPAAALPGTDHPPAAGGQAGYPTLNFTAPGPTPTSQGAAHLTGATAPTVHGQGGNPIIQFTPPSPISTYLSTPGYSAQSRSNLH